MLSGTLTPAFQSPLCDPAGRNNAHIAAYNNPSLNREDGRRACLIPPAANTCNNNESGCYTVLPACDATWSNRPCVTDHLRSYPLNPTSEDLKALGLLDDSFTDVFIYGEGRLVTAIYKEGSGPDNYNLRAMIAVDKPYLNALGDADLVQLGHIINKIGPDGGYTQIAPAHTSFSFTAAAGQNTSASVTQQYVMGGMDFATLAPMMGADAAAKLMIQSSRSGIESNTTTTSARWLGLNSYTGGGVLVMRAGFGSASMDQYVTRDGTKPFTGNVDLGGNKLKNLALVTLDAPCDGTSAQSAESKAMNGQVASHSPRVTDPNNPTEKIGSAYLLVCGYDAFVKGYVWKKATAGLSTVEDAQAGMFEGYESNRDFNCWREAGEDVTWVGGQGPLYNGGYIPASAVLNNGINNVKFVIKNGKAWAYILVDLNNVNAGWMLTGGPYTLDGSVWDWYNYGAFPVLDYDLGNQPTNGAPLGGFRCRRGFGWWMPDGRVVYSNNGVPPVGATNRNNPLDQYFGVLAQWKFSASGIEFIVNGAVSRLNKVFNYPAHPYNFGGVAVDTANHIQDDLARIPVTTTGQTTAAALTGCSVQKKPVMATDGVVYDVIVTLSCSSSNLSVTTTGTSSPRPADPNTAYNSTNNADPVRSLTPVPLQYTRTFAFQHKSNCNRVGGLPTGDALPWGTPPWNWCAW